MQTDTVLVTMDTLAPIVNAGSGSFKSQLKRADKSGARFALILGDSEIENNEVLVKSLLASNDSQEQQKIISLDELSDYIEQHIIN